MCHILFKYFFLNKKALFHFSATYLRDSPSTYAQLVHSHAISCPLLLTHTHTHTYGRGPLSLSPFLEEGSFWKRLPISTNELYVGTEPFCEFATVSRVRENKVIIIIISLSLCILRSGEKKTQALPHTIYSFSHSPIARGERGLLDSIKSTCFGSCVANRPPPPPAPTSLFLMDRSSSGGSCRKRPTALTK